MAKHRRQAKRSICVYHVKHRKIHDAACSNAILIGANIESPRIIFKNKQQAMKYLAQLNLTFEHCDECRRKFRT